jgi:hypothetical protein
LAHGVLRRDLFALPGTTSARTSFELWSPPLSGMCTAGREISSRSEHLHNLHLSFVPAGNRAVSHRPGTRVVATTCAQYRRGWGPRDHSLDRTRGLGAPAADSTLRLLCI